MKKLVVLSGAGISAESGIRTFRDAGGLWEGYDVRDVASPEGWRKNPELVLRFYNERRKQAMEAQPNDAHKILADLEKDFDVVVVTQNIDNLHEKAGSTNVIHLHGEISKVRSTLDENLIYELDVNDPKSWEISLGDKCAKGSQLRPHIVWFGEMVPMMEYAVEEAATADIFMVVGTSLVVYPAAGLINYVGEHIPKFIIDPNQPDIANHQNLFFFPEKATTGMKAVAERLRREYSN
jgi:NAD-dependent deacetylase